MGITHMYNITWLVLSSYLCTTLIPADSALFALSVLSKDLMVNWQPPCFTHMAHCTVPGQLRLDV